MQTGREFTSLPDFVFCESCPSNLYPLSHKEFIMETKTKIILVALLVVAAIFGGIAIYNNYKMQLKDLIPEENWYHVELSAATPTETTAYAVDDDAAWEIL